MFQKNGLHINEDHFIAEIINPKSLKSLKYGEEGELVITTVTKQGFPLIRYRTGDITVLHEEKCKCERTLIRMNRVFGRTDDMIIVDGINIFPAQIEEVLLQVEGIVPHYQIILTRDTGIDFMELQVEVSDKLPFFDELKELEVLRHKLEIHLNNVLGIKSKVTLVEPRTIKRSTGNKMDRVIDLRNK